MTRKVQQPVCAIRNLLSLSLLTLSASLPANQSPPDMQVLRVGELFSYVIESDEGNRSPDISAEDLPRGAVLLNNLDGTRTLMWIPEAEDIGRRTLTLRRTDLKDPTVALEQPLVLTVATEFDYARLRQEQIAKRVVEQQSVADLPAQDTKAAIADPVESKTATMAVDTDDTPATAEPLQVDSVDAPDDQLPPIETVATATVPVTPPEPPRIAVRSVYTFETGNNFQTEVAVEPFDSQYTLNVLNLPTDATFAKAPTETHYLFSWLPSSRDVGTTALIVQLLDAEENLVTSSRVRLIVESATD